MGRAATPELEAIRRAKISATSIGKHNHSGEINPMFGKQHSESTKLLISEANKGNSNAKGASHPKLSEYNRTHIRKGANNPNYGTHIGAGIPKSPECKAKMSRTRIARGLSKGDKNPMSKEENIRKWLKSCNVKPNKAEARLNDILGEALLNEYALNVDGSLIILGGKIPDFVNINGAKKLIELYGDYFHRGQNPQDRIDYFAQYGFSTLVIWESELDDQEKLLKRVKQFKRRTECFDTASCKA